MATYSPRKVVILSGVSGSGKSTLTQQLFSKFYSEHRDAVVEAVSADSFFMKDGVYTFEASKLPEAHGKCFHDFITNMRHLTNLIVVDNTNTTNEEIAPYMLGAQAFGYEAEIMTIRLSLDNLDDTIERLAKRNKHGVSGQAIFAQHVRLRDRQLLPWWKNTNVAVSL